MKKSIILIYLLCTTLVSFAQEKKFTSFELLYDIPQQIPGNGSWVKYSLESIELNNDTLFTLLVKSNHITIIPLSKKNSKFQNQSLILPEGKIPIRAVRHKEIWYVLTPFEGLAYIKDNQYTRFNKAPDIGTIDNFYFIDDKIILFNSLDGYHGKLDLYNSKGELISSSKEDAIELMNSNVYQNKITNVSNNISIIDNKIQISEAINMEKYGKEDTFIGSCKNYGYFIDWDNRDHIIIRNMDNLLEKEYFKLPIKFSETSLGIPEEGWSSINIRVLSEDNNTFYFATLKHGHLMIYKAVR